MTASWPTLLFLGVASIIIGGAAIAWLYIATRVVVRAILRTLGERKRQNG